jgi:hypothetical protein
MAKIFIDVCGQKIYKYSEICEQQACKLHQTSEKQNVNTDAFFFFGTKARCYPQVLLYIFKLTMSKLLWSVRFALVLFQIYYDNSVFPFWQTVSKGENYFEASFHCSFRIMMIILFFLFLNSVQGWELL